MSESEGLKAAKNLIRRQGGRSAPSVENHVPELRTPIKWKASSVVGDLFRPESFQIVVWQFGVPFVQVEGLHDWLATNEVQMSVLCTQDTENKVQYLGTYLHVDVGGPRYQTFWGLRGKDDNGAFDTIDAERALDQALGPSAANPALRSMVQVLRGYWVRDPGATDHRYGQARHYINIQNQDLGCFWEVTRKARNEQPIP